MASEKSKSKKEGSIRKAQRSGSNVFAQFDQSQIQEFKEAFQLIDQNKDGFIDKEDLRTTLDSLGRVLSDKELEEMLAEAHGPLNFTMLLTIFGERIQGADPEDVIIKAFKTFDMHEVGKVEEAPLRKLLINVGDKLEEEEVAQAFGDAPIDDKGWLDYYAFCRLICRGKEDEDAAS